jgi:hypothetical protein
MKNKDINININPSGKKEPIYTQVVKWITSTIANAKWTKILKVYFVMFFFLATGLAGFFAYNIVKNEEFLSRTAEKFADESTKQEDIRDFVVTPQVQHLLGALLYSLDADRVFVFELHNGKKNISGLPFRYADMSYEFANRERGIDRCYTKFQDVPLTMYTYPEYMYKHKFFLDTADKIQEIDYDFGKQLKEEGGEYVGMIYLNGTDGPIGFLGISFHDKNAIPNKTLIESKLKECGATISELLDLETQLKKSEEEKEND